MKNKFIKLFIIFNISIGLLLPFKMHTDRIRDIVASIDGKLYITADKSGQINIWDASSNKIINHLPSEPPPPPSALGDVMVKVTEVGTEIT